MKKLMIFLATIVLLYGCDKCGPRGSKNEVDVEKVVFNTNAFLEELPNDLDNEQKLEALKNELLSHSYIGYVEILSDNEIRFEVLDGCSSTSHTLEITMSNGQSNCEQLANFNDCDIDKRLICENGLYFLVENGRHFLVDTNVITVKLKPGEELGEEFEVISSNILGFTKLSVPKGVDVVGYACMLKKTGKFEIVELNSFGSWGT
jgi:hypothetical protein